MRFRKSKVLVLLLLAVLASAAFFGIRVTYAGVYLGSPHGDATNGVNRDAGYAQGHCAQCHDPHSGTAGGYNLIYEGTAMCFNNGGGSCHNAQPATYPCGEADRLPSSDTANHYYFENNTAGTKDAGTNNRCRWPGATVYTDTGTDATSSKYYSPHYMDTDMPKKDSSNRGLCTNCHNPHGVSGTQLDMLKGVYNTPGPAANYNLCFQVGTTVCHDTGGVPSDAANELIKGYFTTANTDNIVGHQIICSTKSVSGSCPPTGISSGKGVGVGDTLPCYSCHNPHGSEGSNGANKNTYLISDQSERGWYDVNDPLGTAADMRDFCAGRPAARSGSAAGTGGCHVYSDGGATTKSVMSISLKAIPALTGNDHQSTDTESCTSCHENVHRPNLGGECKSCHASAKGTGGYRRQITSGGISGGDIGNDTSNVTSFHINATYANLDSVDCEDCHEQASGGAASHMSITDPGVDVYDPDNGATIYQYTGVATQLNTFCVNCHDAGGATRLLAGARTTPFTNSGDSTTVPNIQTFWVRTYNHNKTTPAVAGCMHCHGNSGNNDTTQNPRINAHGSTADKILTDGVNPTNSTAGAAPSSYTLGTIASPGSGCGGTCTDLDVQYRICFKCHSNWSGAPAGMPTRNLAIEFNPANDSYHWVEGDKGSGPKASTAYGNFNSTYVATMMPGRSSYTDASLRTAAMRCSDCHGGNGVTSTSLQGPHGSTVANILKVPSGSGYNTWNASVNYQSNSTTIWCFNCHSNNFTNTGYDGADGNMHTTKHDDAPCQDCHLQVPHGSGLNDAGTALVGTSAQRKRLLRPTVFDESMDTGRSGGDYIEDDHNYLDPGHPT